MNHPILGSRLECATRIVLDGKAHPREVFGELDYQKFVSCMTLFVLAAPAHPLFASALRHLSTIDKKTKEMLGEKYDNL